MEAGLQDLDGSALGEVMWQAEWLKFQGEMVARIAQAIDCLGSFADLPLLADALAEAGSRDDRMLPTCGRRWSIAEAARCYNNC
jgi:hypothetical protein